jgi:hypothetical protein
VATSLPPIVPSASVRENAWSTNWWSGCCQIFGCGEPFVGEGEDFGTEGFSNEICGLKDKRLYNEDYHLEEDCSLKLSLTMWYQVYHAGQFLAAMWYKLSRALKIDKGPRSQIARRKPSIGTNNLGEIGPIPILLALKVESIWSAGIALAIVMMNREEGMHLVRIGNITKCIEDLMKKCSPNGERMRLPLSYR